MRWPWISFRFSIVGFLIDTLGGIFQTVQLRLELSYIGLYNLTGFGVVTIWKTLQSMWERLVLIIASRISVVAPLIFLVVSWRIFILSFFTIILVRRRSKADHSFNSFRIADLQVVCVPRLYVVNLDPHICASRYSCHHSGICFRGYTEKLLDQRCYGLGTRDCRLNGKINSLTSIPTFIRHWMIQSMHPEIVPTRMTVCVYYSRFKNASAIAKH